MTTETPNVSKGDQPQLLDQTVVVIGGSAGIGLETARHARAEGANVIITGRDPIGSRERHSTLARKAPLRSTPTMRQR